MSEDRSIRVCAVGDLMLGDSAKCIGLGARSLAAEKGAAALFAGVEPLLFGDIVFGNLECVLCDRLFNRYSFTRGQMCSSPDVAGTLAQIGFNVLSVANNHAMQYGAEVFRETCAAVAEKGIAVAGVRDDGGIYTCRPTFVQIGSARVGILAYSITKENYCDQPLYATGSAADIVRDVELLRGGCDHLIVSMHWGCEFITSRSPEQAELGRRIVDAGADLILGHHPHVVQEVEIYNGKPIFYSLGNFISDMVWDEPLLESVIATVELRRGEVLVQGIHQVKAERSLASRHVSACSLEEFLAQQKERLCAEEPVEGESYGRVVEAQRVRQRNLSHLYVLRNVHRYNGLILMQLLARSVKSALFG